MTEDFVSSVPSETVQAALPPLPDATLLGTELSGHVLECYGHTDEAMQAYARKAVLAERERFATLCDNWRAFSNAPREFENLAAAIRQG